MDLDPETLEDGRRLIRAGADRELLLVFFRDRGFDKVDSIWAMKNILGVEAQGGRTCGAARAGSELELPRITLENIDK
jgi:hypothetical protein